jgi:hypothetical protein
MFFSFPAARHKVYLTLNFSNNFLGFHLYLIISIVPYPRLTLALKRDKISANFPSLEGKGWGKVIPAIANSLTRNIIAGGVW